MGIAFATFVAFRLDRNRDQEIYAKLGFCLLLAFVPVPIVRGASASRVQLVSGRRQMRTIWCFSVASEDSDAVMASLELVHMILVGSPFDSCRAPQN